MGTNIITSTTFTTATSTMFTTASASKNDALVQYCFSPGSNCASVLVSNFEKASVSIHVLIYSFTLGSIREALIRAKNRGVDVRVVMERDNVNATSSEYEALRLAGIDVRLDSNPALMHDKLAIVDGHIMITGSYNWTSAANNSNNENLVVIDDPRWAQAFEWQFQSVYSTAH
jgi:phosphatidylserine/phosphatidylglycerophosphate/cardiolipin synthase-like enzyme